MLPPAAGETERIFIEHVNTPKNTRKAHKTHTHTCIDIYANARTPFSSPPSKPRSVEWSAIATHTNTPTHAYTRTHTHTCAQMQSDAIK